MIMQNAQINLDQQLGQGQNTGLFIYAGTIQQLDMVDGATPDGRRKGVDISLTS